MGYPSHVIEVKGLPSNRRKTFCKGKVGNNFDAVAGASRDTLMCGHSELHLPFATRILWSVSMITLQWVQYSKHLKVFVRNQTQEIKESAPNTEFCYIKIQHSYKITRREETKRSKLLVWSYVARVSSTWMANLATHTENEKAIQWKNNTTIDSQSQNPHPMHRWHGPITSWTSC